MRLSPDEQAIILEEIERRDPQALVFLFGSRSDDTAKGGDIDLLVESHRITFSDKLSIVADIKARIGDQKIDLLVTKERFRDSRPFVVSVSQTAYRLSK